MSIPEKMVAYAKGKKGVEPPMMDGECGGDGYDMVDGVAASMFKAKGRFEL